MSPGFGMTGISLAGLQVFACPGRWVPAYWVALFDGEGQAHPGDVGYY